MKKKRSMTLEALELPWETESPLPERVSSMLERAEGRLQAYWDQWHRRPIEQYVACDFRDVYRALATLTEQSLASGKLFCEWGCGLGVVTAMASLLGWEAVGVEAEPFLVQQARDFLRSEEIAAEIWHGNFLPEGAERLARQQANHASLFHQVPVAYGEHDLEVSDFAVIFAYPWPGEDGFLKEVFFRYAAPGGLLLLFLGPYEIELFRKPANEGLLTPP